MIAETLLSNTIIPLRTSDTGEEALGMMNDFYVRHLPVVNNEQLLGLMSEDDILNHDVEEAIGSYALSSPTPCVRLDDHIYELMRMLAEYNLTLVPVVDDRGNYSGLVTLEDLMRFFADSASFKEPGSIIVLEMTRRDYSLSEIARIVESESAVILNAFVQSQSDSPMIDVTLKINRQEINSIVSTFERYDYTIKASFNESEYVDSLRDRYDALISYLNV
ncbi:MAG: CBS domain-containing protein [Saprospiraceae bacterium]|nr:CBS domain-containing protein [Lewinella sp.]